MNKFDSVSSTYFFNLQNPIFPLITDHPVYARNRRNFASKIFGTTREGGNEKRVANHVATFPNGRCCYRSADFSNGVTAGGRQIICNERSDRTLHEARVKIQREIIESLYGVATGRFQSRQFLFEGASTVKCDRDARGYLRGKMSQEVGVHLNSPELLRIYIAIPRRRNEMSFRKTLAIAF